MTKAKPRPSIHHTKLNPEVEVGTALTILEGMKQSIDDLEKFWPPSKRGSNAQRMLNELKEKWIAAVLCLKDAQKGFGT